MTLGRLLLARDRLCPAILPHPTRAARFVGPGAVAALLWLLSCTPHRVFTKAWKSADSPCRCCKKWATTGRYISRVTRLPPRSTIWATSRALCRRPRRTINPESSWVTSRPPASSWMFGHARLGRHPRRHPAARTRSSTSRRARTQPGLPGGRHHTILQGGLTESIELIEQAIAEAEQAGIHNAYTIPNYTWYATVLRQFLEQHEGTTPFVRRTYLKRALRAARRAIRFGRVTKNDLPQAYREYGVLLAIKGRSAPPSGGSSEVVPWPNNLVPNTNWR